jgi:putative ribosome biogenesis GTPase RsgA
MSDLKGTIVAAHGRHYLADVGGAQASEFLQCVTRGKKTNVAVGDIVHLKRTSNDQAVIEKIAERSTLLYRSDQYKSKLLAANITRLFIVVATEPSFADDLVSRSLVACEAAGVEAHLILNKVDVMAPLARARETRSSEKLGSVAMTMNSRVMFAASSLLLYWSERYSSVVRSAIFSITAWSFDVRFRWTMSPTATLVFFPRVTHWRNSPSTSAR